MRKKVELPRIETILDDLGIDLTTIKSQQDAEAIVGVILAFMCEEAERHLETVEVPIKDMLWLEVE